MKKVESLKVTVENKKITINYQKEAFI